MSIPVIGVVPLWDEEKGSLWMLPGYMDAISRAGGLPIMLPLTSDGAAISRICGTVDGLLFTGGQDISPGLYHEEAIASCGDLCKKRDDMETALFSRAVADMDKPALGICRGIQLINVALGGTLYQDLPSQYKGKTTVNHKQALPADVPSHTVTIIKGSPLGALLKSGSIEVNSSHHQGIRELSPELERMAVSGDGLVEAAHMPKRRFVWAVQWHPERTLYDENSLKIFEAFIGSCR